MSFQASLIPMTELGSLDRFFAETILKKHGTYCEEQILALARLMQGSRAGNLCLEIDQIGTAIESLPSTIVEEGQSLFPKAPVIRHENHFYLQKNWVYETFILQHVRRLRQNAVPTYFDRNIFEQNLSCLDNHLLPAQKTAIQAIMNHSFLVICGGPGTGKTYTAGHLTNLLLTCLKKREKQFFRICAAAPTGKAACHLQSTLLARIQPDQMLQIEAMTLHRLLNLQPHSSRLFSKKRIDADLIIVDEASMIDVALLAHLLEAVGDETLLILIGDPDQLPPIEAGSLFAEMGAAFGVRLDQCMRTEDFHLQQLAAFVKQGNAEGFFRLLEQGHPNLLRLDGPCSFDVLYAKTNPFVGAQSSDPKEQMQKYNRFRILNAIRQREHGADVFNRKMLQVLQDTKRWWAAPILAIVNDTFSGFYNGKSGLLIGQGSQDSVSYFPDPLSGEMHSIAPTPPYELAFCLSIHKSQGSEFEELVALFSEGSEHFGREALYTAITRAKRKIEIIGQKEVLQKMISVTAQMKSGFAKRLRTGLYSRSSNFLNLETAIGSGK